MRDRPVLVVLLIIGGLVLSEGAAPAQTSAVDRDSLVEAQSAELQVAKSDHLWRVAAWGGANALGGLALMWAS